ncbi:Trk system potassium transporter TrkA [Anaerosphaera multitolerans]|uniref:Trk system potassium uptake protein TrkA n=1 Tax=Anaerosphaera multitolerans TaxID=2487351 RepID=A0A437S5D3_9FIRM|nr:Trk system potassium transporter TrkA [Anaerosphaera multitolerans]RVU54220.1 Trk system potassium transporter TrkA [Anaerosphaera multitolerans]
MKVLIAGIGKLGFRVAQSLVDEGMEVIIVDKNEQVVENATNTLDVMSVNGNALDLMLLKELGIEQCDIVIATTRSDEANVILCTIAKKMGCGMSIARVRNPEYHKHLNYLGEELNIDLIVNPDYESALAIEKYLLKKYLLMSDDFAGGKVKLVEFNIGENKHFVGKKLMELEGFENLLITTIARDGKTIIPNGQTVLEENDVILLVGDSKTIEFFDKEHSDVVRLRAVQKVMIVGGGKIGYYLGKLLVDSGIEITIVEVDMDRCLFLKEKLPEATIINGDGTDMNLLEEEMIHTFDGFVAATGIDEANLLISLVAKQVGVYKTVAKISRSNYNSIIDKLYIDAVFNTNYITAGRILRVIRGSGSLSVNLMLSGDAEFTELVLKEGVLALNKQVQDLNLKKGVLIVSVVRDNEVIIPKGDTVLKAGDHVIIFWAHDMLDEMNRVFKTVRQKNGLFSSKHKYIEDDGGGSL